MNKIIDNIQNTVKDNVVIIACSTGSDSMALLTLCQQALKKEQIIIAHVNHNVRSQSDNEQQFIEKYAKENNLKIAVCKLEPITNNFEANARNKRYEFLTNTATKFNAKYILLGHHADDNLETIIMRFLKSSSLKGYAGIEEITKYQNLYLFRPLLKISKSKILEYVNNNNITYFDDYTNLIDDHLRNRIRKYITPFLQEENPNLYEAVNYYSESLLGANKLLEQAKIDFINNYVQIVDNNIIFEYHHLKDLDDYLIRQILFRILKPYSLSRYMIDEIIKIIKSKKNKVISNIANKTMLIKEYGKCILTNEIVKELNFELVITKEGIYDLPNNGKIQINKNNCYFTTGNKKICYNILGLPITIRNRKNGDTIKRISKDKTTKAIKTYRQKVSDVLTNRKVPYLQRLNTLVVTDAFDEVLFILGLTIS